MPAEESNMHTVVVVTGGASLAPIAIASIPDEPTIIAADGGLDYARAAGLEPEALVGDLDSVSTIGLAWATAHIDVHRYPADKLATDTELAIAHALTLNPNRLVLLAGAGDRIDHTVAALGALGAPALDRVGVVEAWWGTDHLFLATSTRPVTLAEPAGTTFSVLAMHGPCHGVDIVGARWPLSDADVGPLVGLGVSNQVGDEPVDITVRDGVLTVMIPGAQPP